MGVKSIAFNTVFIVVMFTFTVNADSRQETFRCRKSSTEDETVRVKWDLAKEDVFHVDFFFVATRHWTGEEDGLLNFYFDYLNLNNETTSRQLVVVPPVSNGSIAIPPPSSNATFFHFHFLRIGWNNLSLGFSNSSLNSWSLLVDNLTTGVDIEPQGPLVLRVRGLNAFVNCNGSNGYTGGRFYEFSATFSSVIVDFLWDEEKIPKFTEGGRQRITTYIDLRDLLVTTYPGGKKLFLCQERTARNQDIFEFHLMRKCRRGWREGPRTRNDGQGAEIFISARDLDEEDRFMEGNYSFVQLNFTMTRAANGYTSLFPLDQWPVEVYYEDVFPFPKECLPYSISLVVINLCLMPLSITLILMDVWYLWKYLQQKKINRKLNTEKQRLKKEVDKLLAKWYVNAFPGEIKKLIDERKQRMMKLQKLSPSTDQTEVQYDTQAICLRRQASGSNERTMTQRSDSSHYETILNTSERCESNI